MQFKSVYFHKTFYICLILIYIFFQAGCSSENVDIRQEERDQIVIGLLICMSEETPFFISLVKGAHEASERLDIKLIVLYAHDDPDLQAEQMMYLAEQGVQAILLNPVSDSIHSCIVAVTKKGIPVFTIDRCLACTCIVSHIASNNLDGGRMAGVYMAEILNREGKVVELKGTPGSSAALERGNGFNQAISNYSGIELIASVNADFNQHDGKRVFAEILDQYPEIDGVFAHNDDMILGAIQSAKEAGRDKDIIFIGFDGIKEAIDALERGELIATIAQRPEEIGRIGLETVVDYLSGKEVPDTIFIDLALILK